MVFRFKCYNLPIFGWWDGNVDKYSVFIFFSCNLIRIFCMGCQTWYFILNVIICHFSGGGMVMWTTTHCFDFLCM